MMVIQLESLDFLKENGYPEDNDCIVDPDELIKCEPHTRDFSRE